MANTGWRGLRLGFVGTRGGAYRTLLPGFLAAVVFFALAVLGQDDATVRSRELTLAQAGPALMLLVFYALLPYMFWLMRRYQHQHYTVAAERSQFSVSAGAFYGVSLRMMGLSLLAMVPAALIIAGVFWVVGAAGGAAPGQPPDAGLSIKAMAFAFIGVLAAMLVFQVLVRPYLTSRMQNLVWNGTRSQHLTFASALRLRPLMWLTAKNWLLILVTLGLYFPFAAVAMARLRLEAVSVLSRIDPATLVGLPRDANEAAAGDAAGDLFGIDIGL
jgi:uncharacterized membrane protein YjgN (DUF898 family)